MIIHLGQLPDDDRYRDCGPVPLLDRYPQKFNLDDALIMAHACEAVYQFGSCLKPDYLYRREYQRDLERMSRTFKSLGFAQFQHVDLEQQMGFFLKVIIHYRYPSPVFAAFVQSPKRDMLVFRGTVLNRVLNWLADVDFDLVPFPVFGSGALVHKGFAEALDVILDQVLYWLQSRPDPNRELWLCGHSLGGAMAALTAARLADSHKITRLYTFGQPRVGNEGFVTMLDAKLKARGSGPWIKIGCDNDLIGVLPPCLVQYHDNANVGLLATNRLQAIDMSRGTSHLAFEFSVWQEFLLGLKTQIEKRHSNPLSDLFLNVNQLVDSFLQRGGLELQERKLINGFIGQLKVSLGYLSKVNAARDYVVSSHNMASYTERLIQIKKGP